MNYTIISAETPYFDGEKTIADISISGNKYTVCYGVKPEDQDGRYYHRTVDSINEAFRIFSALTMAIALGWGNEKDRVQLLETA